MTKLTEQEIAEALSKLEGWTLRDGKLHREYRFPDFGHAMGFMMTASPAIERNNHHPEWANVYNRVSVDLMTHDAGGITAKDLALAQLLDGIARKLQ